MLIRDRIALLSSMYTSRKTETGDMPSPDQDTGGGINQDRTGKPCLVKRLGSFSATIRLFCLSINED
ncbi:hypothetical protein [Desulfovermiculus halophilus]|uniref:hypothetical protein n=1 Tax=Desulfovermiculus halophilus TaxID=339722 RepID=UPI001427CEBA|nr:hypothetical protein [Desulfovermiculus halophilus]